MLLSSRLIVACAGIATLAACSGVHLKGLGASGVGVGAGQRPGVGPAIARAKGNGNEVRYTCRGTRPSGFIAIDYVASDSAVCPLSPTKRRAYGVALVMR